MTSPTAATTVLHVGPETSLGLEVVVGDDRRVHATMSAARPLGPDGRPSAGALGVLVDDVTGYAVIDGLVGGSWSVSTEIWLDLVGAVPAVGPLTARAQVVQASSATAFTEGCVRDGSGALVAVCRQRGRALPESPADMRLPDFRRHPVPDHVVDLIGLRRLDDDVASLQVTPDLANPRHMLHGGITLCAAEVTAVLSRLAAGSDLVTSSIHTCYTRGIPVGAEIELRAETRHSGRTFWISEVTARHYGRVVAVATVSAQAL